MRNPLEYPITTTEIITFLKKVLEEKSKSEIIGNIDTLCISEAIRRISSIQDCYVTRTDDNGNEFIVRDGLSYSDASVLYDLLTKRGHKQVYSIRQHTLEENYGVPICR